MIDWLSLGIVGGVGAIAEGQRGLVNGLCDLDGVRLDGGVGACGCGVGT